MRPFAIAGVQMPVARQGVGIDELGEELDEIVQAFPWIEMVVFSELAVLGTTRRGAITLPGPEEDALREQARRHGLWLVPGTVYERVGTRIYNTAIVIDPNGEVVGRYRKMFPFQPYEPGVEPGDRPFAFDVPQVGRFGLSICYDLWFPETVRWLVVESGVEVIIHPTLTDTIDRDVELAIVRAAAACNQCYVIDVNGLGAGGNGRSAFVGPAGDVLHLAGVGPETIPIEIDVDRVTRGREVGLRGLGQPLKSYRDRKFDFPIYQPGWRSPFLDALGPLSMPRRGSRIGIWGRDAELEGGPQPASDEEESGS